MLPFIGAAQSVEVLEDKIDDTQSKIEEIEEEMVRLRAQLDTIGTKNKTLQETIDALELQRKTLTKDIQGTEYKISLQNNTIAQLEKELQGKEIDIVNSKKTLRENIRLLHQRQTISASDVILSGKTLADAVEEYDQRDNLNTVILENISSLEDKIASLETLKTKREGEKKQLVTLSKDLKSKQGGVLATKSTQEQILKDTKASEKEYQRILAQKTRERQLFEKELLDLELTLKQVIDPGSLPKSEAGILSWPLDRVRVTQYFGNTAFATGNPQIYHGLGHNGIDLGIPLGTPVKAAASGVVRAVGNTDALRTCFSYGKWVAVTHNNGLSTVYAHLSSISVKAGDVVDRGDTIAYSGSTGYSTGPHLHFTVFATQALLIQPVPTSVNCKGVTIPYSSTNGYLNPLSYLPAI